MNSEDEKERGVMVMEAPYALNSWLVVMLMHCSVSEFFSDLVR